MIKIVNGEEFQMTPEEVEEFLASQAPGPETPEEVDPLGETLTKRQINAALILGAGILSPDAFIKEILQAIEDPVERALALNDWETAPYYLRTHPLFTNEDVLAAAGMTSDQVDGLWVLGYSQPK